MTGLTLPPLLDESPLRLFPPPSIKVRQNKRRLAAILARLTELHSEGLWLYRPLPEAQRFHECLSKYRLGEGSTRSTKSTALCVELARALTGTDPFDKYPPRNGVALLLGLKEDNIAMLWRKLTAPGAFKIIRDEQTKCWRAVRPDPNDPLHLDPYDLAHQEKWEDAAPLLPQRFIPRHNIAWANASGGIPRTVRIATTGWRLELRPSGSPPDQGEHYNFVANDEEIEKPEWYYTEIRGLAGLSELPKHTPRLVWLGASRLASPDFGELRNKALAGIPGFSRFVFLIKDNPYVPDEEKAMYYAALPEGERETLYHGIPATYRRQVYGNYEPAEMHGCEPFDIPADWARYAVIDPGTDNCAVLFVAIDPNEQHAWVYGGFVLHNASAADCAYRIKEWERGVQFEAIYLDSRAGSQRSFNADETTAARFARALAAAEVHTRTYGSMHGFFPGNPDVAARTMALRSWLEIRSSGQFLGTPVLQVMKGVLPALDRQIKGAIADRKNPEKRAKIEGQTQDLLDCVEYAASGHLRYHEPETAIEVSVDYVLQDFQAMKRKHHLRGTPSVAVLG